MTSKADFNTEEWPTLVEGRLYAGMRVISADRGGTLRESLGWAGSTRRRGAHEQPYGAGALPRPTTDPDYDRAVFTLASP